MATIVNLRRDIPGQIGQGLTSGVQGFFAGREAQQNYRMREAESQQADQQAAVQQISAALQVIQRLTPDAQAAGFRQLAQAAEARGHTPILQSILQQGAEPSNISRSVEDVQGQAASAAAKRMSPSQFADMGASLIGETTAGLTPYQQATINTDLLELAQDPVAHDELENAAIKQLAAAGIEQPTRMQVDEQILKNLRALSGIGNTQPIIQDATPRLGQSLMSDAQRPRPTTGSSKPKRASKMVPNELPSELTPEQATFAQERMARHLEEGFSPEEAIELTRFELLEYINNKGSKRPDVNQMLNTMQTGGGS